MLSQTSDCKTGRAGNCGMQASKTSDSKGPLAFGELWPAATPRSLRAWREASRKAREEREVDCGACGRIDSVCEAHGRTIAPRSAPLHVVLSQVRVLRTLEEADSVLKQSFPTGSSIKKRNYRQCKMYFIRTDLKFQISACPHEQSVWQKTPLRCNC